MICMMAAINACNVHISYRLCNIKDFHLTRYIGQRKYGYILHIFACSLFNTTFIIHTTVLLGRSCEKKCKHIGTTTEITYTLNYISFTYGRTSIIRTSFIRNVKYPNPHFLRSMFKQRKISNYFTQ